MFHFLLNNYKRLFLKLMTGNKDKWKKQWEKSNQSS